MNNWVVIHALTLLATLWTTSTLAQATLSDQNSVSVKHRFPC